MKKALLISLYLLIVAITNAQEHQFINANTLNIREGAGTDYQIVDKVEKGDEVIVYSTQNGWAKICTLDGVEGYVAEKYLCLEKVSKVDKTEDSDSGGSGLWLIIIVGVGIYLYNKVKKFLFGDSNFSKPTITPKRVSPNPTPAATIKPNFKKTETKKQKLFYCECCGKSFTSIRALGNASCQKNPSGTKHKLYEGTEKDKYACKYCGYTASSIFLLTGPSCQKSPIENGRHMPAL